MPRKHASETVTIYAPWWDKGETVTIREHLTHGMKKQIEQSMSEFIDTSNFDPEDPTSLKVDMKKAISVGDDAKLLLFITEWTLKDSKGNVLPLSQAGLDDLVEEDIKFINDEVEKRNKAVTPEKRDSLLGKQNAGTSENTAPKTQLLVG